MCFKIQSLLSRIEGTITIVGSNRTSWNLEIVGGMAGDGNTMLGSHRSPRAINRHRGLISEAAKLPPYILASSVSFPPARACRRSSAAQITPWTPLMPMRERVGVRGREEKTARGKAHSHWAMVKEDGQKKALNVRGWKKKTRVF